MSTPSKSYVVMKQIRDLIDGVLSPLISYSFYRLSLLGPGSDIDVLQWLHILTSVENSGLPGACYCSYWVELPVLLWPVYSLFLLGSDSVYIKLLGAKPAMLITSYNTRGFVEEERNECPLGQLYIHEHRTV